MRECGRTWPTCSCQHSSISGIRWACDRVASFIHWLLWVCARAFVRTLCSTRHAMPPASCPSCCWLTLYMILLGTCVEKEEDNFSILHIAHTLAVLLNYYMSCRAVTSLARTSSMMRKHLRSFSGIQWTSLFVLCSRIYTQFVPRGNATLQNSTYEWSSQHTLLLTLEESN